MRTIGLSLLLVATLTTLPAPAQPADSLYKRLGGYDAIAAVVDNFVPRLVKDPMLARYFVHSEDTLKQIRQLVVDQVCAATGGPCIYMGRDMKTAHRGLGISGPEWDAAVKHLTATLDQFTVAPREKDELLKIVGTLRADIVEK